VKKAKVLILDSPQAIEARLVEIERKLDRLRALYESFFMGVERVPPNVPRQELNRLILETQQVPINNASLRFRFQSIMQRWVLLTTYWNRTLREIEAGTFRRDISKAQKHLATKGGVLTEADAIALGIPATRAKAFVERQQKLMRRRRDTPMTGPPAGMEDAPSESPQGPGPTPVPLAVDVTPPPIVVNRPAAPERPPAVGSDGGAGVPGVSEEKVRAFFQRYVDAHLQSVGVPPKVTLEQMRERLRRDLPKVLEAKRCNTLELDVAIEDGKVKLKARPSSR
jgi:hypothetical protein